MGLVSGSAARSTEDCRARRARRLSHDGGCAVAAIGQNPARKTKKIEGDQNNSAQNATDKFAHFLPLLKQITELPLSP